MRSTGRTRVGPEPEPVPEGIDRDAVVAGYRRHVNQGQARLAQFLGLPVEVTAQGVHVVDHEGTSYLDCGGYGVFLLGHRHPAVVDAVRRQLDRQPLSTRLFLNDRLAEAAGLLASVAPEGLTRVTFTNSGAEAVELALKLGRASGRTRVVAAEGGFHGKTLGALTATAGSRYRDPFLPLLPLVEHVAFGDVAALERALEAGPATVILEPIQGEGGVRIPPPGYLAAARTVTARHDAMLVVDEIQTGLGRTGSWWAIDAEHVVPDVLLAGETLGGGVMPVGAVISSEAAYAPLNNEPLLHSSTFAGNPLAAAAVCAALRTIRDEQIVDRAAALGARLQALVAEAVAAAGADALVREVRGRGLLIGIEFVHEHHAAVLLEELLTERVIVSYSLNADSVVRLTPPVILTEDHLTHLHEALIASLGRLS